MIVDVLGQDEDEGEQVAPGVHRLLAGVPQRELCAAHLRHAGQSRRFRLGGTDPLPNGRAREQAQVQSRRVQRNHYQ